MTFTEEDRKILQDLCAAVKVQGEQLRELTQLKETVALQSEQLMALKTLADEQSQHIRDLEQKIDDVENQERRNNLIVHGIRESGVGVETWAEAGEKVAQLFANHGLKLTTQMIVRAHRLHSARSPRPIIVKFKDWEQKENLFREGRKVIKGECFLTEDFSARVRKQRQALSPIQKEAYKRNFRTKFKKGLLIIDGHSFTADPSTGKISGPKGEHITCLDDAMGIIRPKRKFSESPSTVVQQNQPKVVNTS